MAKGHVCVQNPPTTNTTRQPWLSRGGYPCQHAPHPPPASLTSRGSSLGGVAVAPFSPWCVAGRSRLALLPWLHGRRWSGCPRQLPQRQVPACGTASPAHLAHLANLVVTPSIHHVRRPVCPIDPATTVARAVVLSFQDDACCQ